MVFHQTMNNFRRMSSKYDPCKHDPCTVLYKINQHVKLKL